MYDLLAMSHGIIFFKSFLGIYYCSYKTDLTLQFCYTSLWYSTFITAKFPLIFSAFRPQIL